jgi:hypothetical protein
MTTTSLWSGGRKELVTGLFLLAMGISHVVLLFAVMPKLRRGYQDFTIFYTAGRMLRTGQAATLYDLAAQYRTQNEFAPDVPIRHAALPYNHPPFEALLFVPLTFVGYLPAYLVWTALNVIFLGTSVVFIKRHLPQLAQLSPVLPILAVVGFFPSAMGIIQGQDSSLLLLIVVLACVVTTANRDVAAGAILALGLFKFHLVVPLALVVSAKRPRLLLGFVPAALALVAGSVALVGWQGTLEYVSFVINLEKSGAGGAISALEMANLHGLVSVISISHEGSVSSAVITVIASVMVLLVAAAWVRQANVTMQRTFALASLAGLLVGYHTMPYDLTLLLPGAFLFFVEEGRTLPDRLLLCVLFLTPLYVFLGLRVNQLGWIAIPMIFLFWRLRGGTATPVPLGRPAFQAVS